VLVYLVYTENKAGYD